MNPLSNYQLAIIAQRLLLEYGGFTLDEFGNSVTGDLWAVSVKGWELRFEYLPTLAQIEAYFKQSGLPRTAYFGGWRDNEEVFYLDHTLTFRHKHTAIHEAKRQHQKAIFHLGTKELLVIGEVEPHPAPDQTKIQIRKELVRQLQRLCDKHGPYAVLAEVGQYLENVQNG